MTTQATLKTKDLASQFGIKPVSLRRVLRSMAQYADGVHTNYRWHTPADNKLIAEIGKAIAKRDSDAAKRKAEALAALAPKSEAKSAKPKSPKKSERKSKIAADPIAERQQAAQAQFDATHSETEQPSV